MELRIPPLIGELSGDLLWGAPEWALPAVLLSLALAGLVIWNYWHRGVVFPVRMLAALLKVLAIVLIAICLLEPLRTGTRARPQANVLPILVDNSQSMRLKSDAAKQSRGEAMIDLLREDKDWRVRLAQAFDVRTYAFDARLENVEDFQSLELDGYVSSMAGGLQGLSERFSDRPVAGTLLFSDGNLTDLATTDFDWSSLGFPVYPVLPTEDDQLRDLRIEEISIRQSDFETAPATIRVSVDSVGIDVKQAFVQLVDLQTGKLVEEKTVSLQGESGPEVRFRFRPERAGVNFYQVGIFTERDRRGFEALTNGEQDDEQAANTVEATLANNRRVVAVNRRAGPYRILYLAGRPNWEYKFLRRALQEDAEVQLVGLLRIANKEPKFSFRDRGVNDTNPLFAGLGKDEEETAEQYDQPVILRLGVKESEELSDGFPESAEELFAYHGVILDDIEADFFTPDQLLLLRRFVSMRGGGLLFLGGQESFDDRRFGDTPLGELAPVYAPRTSDAADFGAVKLSLTREGILQPWMRLRDNEQSEQARLQSMPPFLTVNRTGRLKPGASSLATAETVDGRKLAAVITQRFGNGRTSAIPLGDLWRWSMRRDKDHPDDAAQAWRQLAHWLVGEVPKRAEVRIDRPDDPSQPVTVVVEARDDQYLPLDNATVELEISPLSGESFTLTASPHEQTAGTYSTSYWAREPGGYRVEAKVTAPDGSHVGSAAAGWTVQTGSAEFSDLRLNQELLERIAEETGGEVVRADDLAAFAADLPNRKLPVTETMVYPLWHHPWVMLIAMLCLCIEWGLRRWKGLA